MGKSFKLLFAAVMLMAVMCAGAAFAADTVTVDLKMTAWMEHIARGQDGGDAAPLPNNEIRLWATRRVGSLVKRAKLMDTNGNQIGTYGILFSTKPTAVSTEGKWLSKRVTDAVMTVFSGDGVIDETGISYEIMWGNITLSADVSARSGDRATVYVYGGVSDDQGTTSVQVDVPDGRRTVKRNVEPFPEEKISFTDESDNGAVITSFDVVVLSSDADLILDQIDADPDLGLARGSNIVVKDADGTVADVVSDADPQPLITVELAGSGSEIVVVSSDGSNIDCEYTWGIDPNDARAYLKDGDTTIFTFTPMIDPSGTITYRMDDPGLLLVLKDRLGRDLTLVFGDLNSTYGMALPECLVKFSLSVGGSSGSSGVCGAGAAAVVGLAALALIKRSKRSR